MKNNFILLLFPFYIKNSKGEKIQYKHWDLDNAQYNKNKPIMAPQDEVLYSYVYNKEHYNKMIFNVYSLKKLNQNTVPSYYSLYCNAKENISIKNKKREFFVEILNEGKWCSPRLILSSLSNVGILSIPMSVTNSINADNQTDFNKELSEFSYHIKKIKTSESPSFYVNENDFETLMQNKIEKIKKNNDNSDAIQKIQNLIDFAFNIKDKNDEKSISFTILELCKDLLAIESNESIPEGSETNNQKEVVFFEQNRAQMFSYFTIEKEKFKDEDILNFVRISRGQDEKYKIHNYNDYAFLPFDNIMYVSALEGCGICTCDKNLNKSSFITNFQNDQLQGRYLWLYFMALMQSYLLHYFTDELLDYVLELESESPDNKDKNQQGEMIKKIETLSRMKSRGYFTNVSPYTQHNQFYHFCMKQMNTTELYKEYVEKLRVLQSYIEINEQYQQKQYDKRMNTTLHILTILTAVSTISNLQQIRINVSSIQYVTKFIIFLIFISTISYLFFAYWKDDFFKWIKFITKSSNKMTLVIRIVIMLIVATILTYILNVTY